jgi:hypothetical protein
VDKEWKHPRELFVILGVEVVMRDLALCAAAFSLSLIVGASITEREIPRIEDPERYTMMECQPLADQTFDVMTDEGKYKAAAECFFGGYYPSGPTTGL